MLEIIKKILENVLKALYESFGFAVVMAVVYMFLNMYAQECGWKNLVRRWLKSFKENTRFRCLFVLIFYISMILFRTLLNRSVWDNPVANVIGVWGLYNEFGELTTEVIENLVLFIPFTVLLLWCFKDEIIGEMVKLFKTLCQSVKIVFLFSLSIEFLQLFLRLGTFQLSDLFYNTLGGFVGGLIYWCGYKVTHWRKNKNAKEDEI